MCTVEGMQLLHSIDAAQVIGDSTRLVGGDSLIWDVAQSWKQVLLAA